METKVSTHQERLLWLAQQETTCRHDKVQAWDITEGPANCPDCGGTGKVPRFPTLRQECPECDGTGWYDTPTADYRGIPLDRECYHCQCRGWVVNYSLEAVLEVALSISEHVGIIKSIRGHIEVQIDGPWAKGATIKEAAGRALWKKMQEEVSHE